MKESVARSLKEGSELRLKMAETMSAEIATAATAIAEAFKAGRKLLLFGNGGSAAVKAPFLKGSSVPAIRYWISD